MSAADVLHSRGDLTGVPSFLSALTRSVPWAADAGCRDSDVQWVLDANHEKHQPVTIVDRLEVCSACPVRRNCLESALSSGLDVYGIWGGTTQNERRPYRRRVQMTPDHLWIEVAFHPDAATELEASLPERPGVANEGCGARGQDDAQGPDTGL